MSSIRMEERKECNATRLLLQDESKQNLIHRFYFVRFRPSHEELEKEEANKQYQLMNLARSHITEEIENQKGVEHQINQKLRWFSLRDGYIEQNMREIKNLERYLGKIELSLAEKDAQTTRKLDLKRCQKRLMKKGTMDIEYIQQIQEKLLSSKKSGGMTSSGTQELNDLIESMAQRIQHGNMNQAAEMKTFHEIRTVKETKETYPALEPERCLDWYSREIRSKRDADCKRSAQHRISIRLDDIERLKRDQMGRKAKSRQLKAELELVRKTISCLQKELEDVKTKRLNAYKRAHEFGDQNEELKSRYIEYQSLMAYAKELAQRGDVKELEVLRNTQVEEFTRQWNESKAFRDDYERKKVDIKVRFTQC